jgi:threonine dehydratase
MPKFAALIKVTNCRVLGATVVLHGADLGEARARAEELAATEGLAFVHPFDNLDVIAGQGTMALEILDQTPDIDAIVIPVGGGGLLAGVATVVKARQPQTEVIGVEADHAPCLVAALAAGEPVDVTLRPTLADGLAVARIGARSFAILKDTVDQVVTVDEASIALAILRLIELEKSVVEGAGETPLAAFLAGKLGGYQGKRVVLALCGGNIDLTMLDRVIEVGLVADGRLARFTVSITDRPGAWRGWRTSSRRRAPASGRSCTIARSPAPTCPRCASSASSTRPDARISPSCTVHGQTRASSLSRSPG